MLKNKYLLPLILILLLTFTLIGDCWVSGYDQRIKLTIDHTKIDNTLTNFPVTVFLTSTQGEEVFDEFSADEDFDRGQFALGDDTLLYAEKELFDVSESKGLYHVKIPSISSSVDTDYYFYYDKDADHNTTYIGAIGTTAGENVWDSNFKAVYHMVDNTTSTILDSTSTNNDGTKKDANEPIETVGKVGQGQDFDATNDFINCGDDVSLRPSQTLTYECIAYPDATPAGDTVCICGDYELHARILWNNNDKFKMGLQAGSWAQVETAAQTKENWYYVAFTYDGNIVKGYLQGTEFDTNSDASGDIDWAGADLITYLGSARAGTIQIFPGKLDEFRISSLTRSAAWIKATYNSLWDTLLTYGSEETKPSVTNIMFIFSNF